MKTNVLFSIVVPVFNVELYLHQCVESILKQQYKNYELILVDDGSTDQSPSLCDKYAQKYNQVKVIHKTNGGLSSARNAGMRIASGQYIVFLDSDDYWIDSSALGNIASVTEREKPDVLVLKSVKYSEPLGKIINAADSFSDKDFDSEEYNDRLCQLVQHQLYDTCAWNKVFSKNLMNLTDLYFEEGIIAEDIDWAARVALVATSIAIVKEPVHVYRVGRPGSITSKLSLKNIVDTKESIERCLNYPELKKKDERFFQAYYSYVAYRYVIWMAESATVKNNRQANIMITEMKKYHWLLGYDLNEKVKLVKRLYKILGYNVTACFLKAYLIRRK